MPFDSISAANDSDFPTRINDVNLTLGQINWLARVFDALRDEGETEEPMAVAISQFNDRYRVEGSGSERRYVLRDKAKFESIEEAKIASALTEIDGKPLTLDQINEFVWMVGTKVTEKIVLSGTDGLSKGDIDDIIQLCTERFLEFHVFDEEEGAYVWEWELREEKARPGLKRAKEGEFVKRDEMKRMVLQPLWVPRMKDRDNEGVTAEEIEKGFYRTAIWRAKQTEPEVGINHEGDTIKGIYIVQDYLVENDMIIDNTLIPAGSHVRETHFDPSSEEATKAWEGILDGTYTGISPQGRWEARPVRDEKAWLRGDDDEE